MFAKLRTRLAAMQTIKQLLEEAERIAAERGAGRPSAEHLVLAALELPDGTARRTFERLGRAPADFATALDDQEADDLRQVGVEAPLATSVRSCQRQACPLASTAANRLRGSCSGSRTRMPAVTTAH